MMKTNTDPIKIKEVLERGVDKIYPNYEILANKLASGQRLKLYCGYDPTAPVLHLGHLITLKKMAQFQELGHEVIMLIGDFTGMIGDPTEKLSVRKKLTRKEVLRNAKNYKRMASCVLDFQGKNKARILFNSSWQDRLKFDQLINLAAFFTVQQMLVRDFFQERLKKKNPIFLHEFLYPLAQAYDSVAMDVDLEIGGRDQTFNMMCGRDLLRETKGKEKFVMTMKLLIDSRGKKMGKTEGNLVSLEDSPGEIFGKIMSWPDELIEPGLELLTDIPSARIKDLAGRMNDSKINPRDIKKELAREIVSTCHSGNSAKLAEKEFERVFEKKEMPEQIIAIKTNQKNLDILDLLLLAGLSPSKSEAKRLVLQGAVKINGLVERDWRKSVAIQNGLIVRAGKRKFAKLILKD